MKIGILGSGNVGQQLALGFMRLGNEVTIGTRHEGKLSGWLESDGKGVSVASFADTAKNADVIVLATLWTGTENAIQLAGIENFDGKIVIDVTNPLDFSKGAPPQFVAELGNSGGERVQNWLTNSKIVKAFNTINARTMCNPQFEDGSADLFIAGNDDEAKSYVSELATEWGWGHVIDMGDISKAYWIEAFAMIWIEYGFKNNNWSHAFKLLKK